MQIAKEDKIEAVEDASKFDFVGGGTASIAKPQLTGAHIDLVLLFEAVEEGIKQYPDVGCDDIHQYIEKMSRSTITKVLLLKQNLGVEDNPHFRGAPLHVVKAFTLKFQSRT